MYFCSVIRLENIGYKVCLSIGGGCAQDMRHRITIIRPTEQGSQMRYVIFIFLIWALWASLSTGGLYELKQINPKFPHPNKSVPYLLSELDYSASSGFIIKIGMDGLKNEVVG